MEHEIHRVPLNKITEPLKRQRQGLGPPGTLDELMESIKRIGLINPIVLTRDNRVVAGSRRFNAYKYLALQDSTNLRWKLIDARYVDTLDEKELKLIELEENVKRVDLPWQDHANATLEYYELHPDGYTVEDLAADLGVAVRTCQRHLAVANALRAGDKNVAAATSLVSAYSVVTRQMNRAVDSEMRDFVDSVMDTAEDAEEPAAAAQADAAAPAPRAGKKRAAKVGWDKEVICQDFTIAAREYSGPKFNFLHCDFPFGVNLHQSDQVGTGKWEEYEDTPEIYWRLVECLLETHDRLLTTNGHILFWFSMTQYERTRNLFLGAGFRVNPFPIIWHKSDNIGIVPDPKRRPRQVYESALLITKGDRFLVSPKVNCYSLPSGRRQSQHVSQKPVEMLKEVMSMLVDGSTRMLDPTCGSGTALSAAMLLGASSVEGWDINVENTRLTTELVHETRQALLRGGGLAPPDGQQPSSDDLAALGAELLG